MEAFSTIKIAGINFKPYLSCLLMFAFNSRTATCELKKKYSNSIDRFLKYKALLRI